jgi:hypothetical protein
VAGPQKHGGMSLFEIAEIEGSTPEAVRALLRGAMRKLRKRGLPLTTARALADELERNRATAHSLSRPRSGKKGGAQ